MVTNTAIATAENEAGICKAVADGLQDPTLGFDFVAVLLVDEKTGDRVVVADVDEPRAQQVADNLTAAGRAVEAMTVDVTSEGEVAAMVDATRERLGRIDALVCSAAVETRSSVLDCGDEQWQHVIDVNLKGPFLCMKHTIPVIAASGGGAVVLLGSVLLPIGLMPSAGEPRMASDGSDGTDRSNSFMASDGTDGSDRSNSLMASDALDGTDRSNSLMASGAIDGTDRSNSFARARRPSAPADADDERDDDAIGNRAEPDDEAPAPRGRRRWSRFARDRSKPPVLKIGVLPIARRDSERLRQILSLQNRLRDLDSTPRAKRALIERGPFNDTLTWLEIHGNTPEIVEHWRGFIEALEAQGNKSRGEGDADGEASGAGVRRRRRRGGRRRGGRARRPRES